MKLKRILPTLMTLAAVSVFAMSQALLAPLAARIAASFGHGLGWSGLLFAAGCIPYIVAGPFAGRLVSAAGRHFSVSLMLGLCAVSAVFVSYADRFWLVCIGLALLGTAAVFVLLTGAGAVSALTAMPYAACMPACAVALGVGAVCGSLLGGLMTFYGYGWQKVYFVFGCAAAVASVLHTVIPFPRLEDVQPERWKLEFWSALRMQRMYSYFFAVFLYAGAEMLAAGWLAAYMTHELGYTTAIAAAAVAVTALCATLGRLFCAQITDRIAPQALSAILCIILVCALGLCAAVADGKAFWFAVCFIGVGLSALWQLLFSAALDANEGGGATLAALLLWMCAGEGLCAAAAGVIGSWFGMRKVIVLAILLFLVVMMVLGNVLSRRQQVPARRIMQAAEEEYIPPEEPDEFSDLGELDGLDELTPIDRFAALPEYDVFKDDLDFGDDTVEIAPEVSEEFADLAEPVEMDAAFVTYPDDAVYDTAAGYETEAVYEPETVYEPADVYEPEGSYAETAVYAAVPEAADVPDVLPEPEPPET